MEEEEGQAKEGFSFFFKFFPWNWGVVEVSENRVAVENSVKARERSLRLLEGVGACKCVCVWVNGLA